MLNRLLAIILVLFLWPLLAIIAVVVWLSSGWPILFVQKRGGARGNLFKMFKFRTMVVGAEKRKIILKEMNEANGPVFKIRNDPRFTKVGKFLSHSGLDELPQLFNVIKGEMNLVGPRPLLVEELKFIPRKTKALRESVMPGIISPWIFSGYHNLSFEKWMEEDRKYIENKNWRNDVWLTVRGMWLLVKLTIKEWVALVN